MSPKSWVVAEGEDFSDVHDVFEPQVVRHRELVALIGKLAQETAKINENIRLISSCVGQTKDGNPYLRIHVRNK